MPHSEEVRSRRRSRREGRSPGGHGPPGSPGLPRTGEREPEDLPDHREVDPQQKGRNENRRRTAVSLLRCVFRTRRRTPLPGTRGTGVHFRQDRERHEEQENEPSSEEDGFPYLGSRGTLRTSSAFVSQNSSENHSLFGNDGPIVPDFPPLSKKCDFRRGRKKYIRSCIIEKFTDLSEDGHGKGTKRRLSKGRGGPGPSSRWIARHSGDRRAGGFDFASSTRSTARGIPIRCRTCSGRLPSGESPPSSG